MAPPPRRRLSSARPRDRLGRPLPFGTVGFPEVPERDTLDSGAAIGEALAYLERGLPFHAHEVLEQRWRCCPSDERGWWRALAQAAAAATHRARGNAVGAERLLERARLTRGGKVPTAVLAATDARDIGRLLADLALAD